MSAGCSPYDASMMEIAKVFGRTIERAAILKGVLELRAKLASLGIMQGYQWFAGSFCEDIERLENRCPSDIDVVTFFVRPKHLIAQADWSAWVASNRAVFDPIQTKAAYRCDAYYVDTNTAPHCMISQTTYWHGLFGHQRKTHTWKGMLRVSLVSDDADASDYLSKVWP